MKRIRTITALSVLSLAMVMGTSHAQAQLGPQAAQRAALATAQAVSTTAVSSYCEYGYVASNCRQTLRYRIRQAQCDGWETIGCAYYDQCSRRWIQEMGR